MRRAKQWLKFISVMLASFPLLAQAQGKDHAMEHPTLYRTTQIDGWALHFALGTAADQIAQLVRNFLSSGAK